MSLLCMCRKTELSLESREKEMRRREEREEAVLIKGPQGLYNLMRPWSPQTPICRQKDTRVERQEDTRGQHIRIWNDLAWGEHLLLILSFLKENFTSLWAHVSLTCFSLLSVAHLFYALSVLKSNMSSTYRMLFSKILQSRLKY